MTGAKMEGQLFAIANLLAFAKETLTPGDAERFKA